MTNEEIIDECVENALQSIRYALKHQDFTGSEREYEMGWKVACDVISKSIRERVKEKTLEWMERKKLDENDLGFFINKEFEKSSQQTKDHQKPMKLSDKIIIIDYYYNDDIWNKFYGIKNDEKY